LYAGRVVSSTDPVGLWIESANDADQTKTTRTKLLIPWGFIFAVRSMGSERGKFKIGFATTFQDSN
jgi:hypothetical protein